MLSSYFIPEGYEHCFVAPSGIDTTPYCLKRANNSSIQDRFEAEKDWYINFNPFSIQSLYYGNMNTQNQVEFITSKIRQLQTDTEK